MSFIPTILEQGLLMLPLVFGIYISYCILKITDLTVDGTFVLGAVIFARTLEFGVFSAIACSMLGGAIVGVLVSIMQKHNKVSDLVVGILASFMLYSINLNILGRPNISLIDKENILTVTGIEQWISILAIIACILITIITFVLKSNIGLYFRAFGYNKKLLNILGKPTEFYRMLGLSLSNSLASLSGALTAQVNCFADINMGIGVALVGIGAVVIGQHLSNSANKAFTAMKDLLLCFIGILLYFLSMNLLLIIGINPINLKLILGLLLFFTLRSIRSNEVIK